MLYYAFKTVLNSYHSKRKRVVFESIPEQSITHKE